MKKLLALLLAVALLLPMGLVPVANAEGEVTKKPFYAVSWSGLNTEKHPNLYGLVWSIVGVQGDKVKISHGGVTLMHGLFTDDEVTAYAQALKKDMDARPEGTRFWHLFRFTYAYDIAPKNVVFLDFGVDQLANLMDAILKKYKEIDGKLDGIVLDAEYLPMSSYYLHTKTASKDNLIYSKIVKDPRYATEIRPMLVERGFKFWPADKITNYTPEIYGISRNVTSAEYDESKNIWDTVMRIRLNNYINEWAWTPLQKYFPTANLSDYQSIDSATWLKMAAVTDDGQVISGGNSHRSGDTSCFSYYYARPSTDFFKNHQKYAGYNDAIFLKTPFNGLLYDINFTRHVMEATDTKKYAPWITSYTYGGKKEGSIAYTPYYAELLYHLGMFDPQPFLSYTVTEEHSATDWVMIQEIMDDILDELNRVAGFSDRKHIEMPMNWNSKFVLSGMYANGRNIWRITPDTTVVSVEDFKVEGTDPTFRVNGQTVTFPGGKIIADTPIATAGSCGYWVETAKDVTPVVTTEADRFDKYPALFMDFEDAKEGKFDFNSSTPTNAWEFTWKNGGKSTIVAQNGNKVLAINGDTSVRSKNLPGNVTAGDSYAKDQAWQITATIPEGLAAAAEVNLLKYAGKDQEIDDGGFQIKGGKLYYSQLKSDATDAEYVELMDIAAGTYTFKRVMDFNDNKACATYYVYDAAGKELKASAKVATPAFSAINTIELAGCTGADKDVLLDNFKLSVIGTAIDFGTYNANTGMVQSPSTTNAFSTAYRVSWLNATAKEETATIIAEIYEGTTLKETKTVKEIKMAPGCSSAETGIVEIAEGQSVKVSVTSNVKVNVLDPNAPAPVPQNPTTNPAPTPSETAPVDNAKKSDNTPIIVLIAVVVVAVVAVVLVLVLTKKPAPKAEEKVEEAEDKAEEKTEE